MVECKRCLMTSEITNIENGECDFCRMHDKLSKNTPEQFDRIVRRMKKRKGYQVLIGISGGFDSAYMLWYAISVLKLKVFALHFDNGWNAQEADYNINQLLKKFKVDYLRVCADEDYDLLCKAFRYGGTCDVDIPNDMYMADIMQTTAQKFGIKYIFNGHDFRTEGSTPLKWTYMDARYIKDVFRKNIGREIQSKHIQTFWKQILAGLRGIKHIRPFHYVEPKNINDKCTELGLVDYGVKHGENIYTKWVGYKLLPDKFGIDKRIVYLSAQMRSGTITRQEAEDVLSKPVKVDELFEVNDTIRDRSEYDHYNFKRWKFLIWVMMKLKLTSYNFYKKYT